MANSRAGPVLDAAQDALRALVLPYWAAVRRSRPARAARRAGDLTRPTARRASSHDLGLVTGKPGAAPLLGGGSACPALYPVCRPAFLRFLLLPRAALPSSPMFGPIGLLYWPAAFRSLLVAMPSPGGLRRTGAAFAPGRRSGPSERVPRPGVRAAMPRCIAAIRSCRARSAAEPADRAAAACSRAAARCW